MNANAIFQWMIGSTYFKKYSSFFGGVALGMWIQAMYWKQIAETLGVWDIQRSTFMKALLLVAGTAGIGSSVILSMIKSKQDQPQQEQQQQVQK